MTRLLKLRKTKSLLNIFIISFIFVSCVNEDNQLGLDIVKTSGGMDILSSPNNMVSLNVATFKADSLKTAGSGVFVLGSYKDAYFGKVETSIYTSLGLQDKSGNDFTNLGVIDSAVLCLAYSPKGVFAKDTSIKQDNMNLKVYMLSANIDTSKTYSDCEVQCEPSAIFDAMVVCDPLHGVKINGEEKERVPHMRMPLNDNFIAKLQKGKYATQEEFKQDFKGLKISATSSSDAFMAYVNMISDQSGIYVYYHDKDGQKGNYLINFSTKSSFMHIDYDYSGSNIAVLENKKPNDTLKTQDYLYLAALGVAESKINLDGLTVWYNSDSVKGAALNRAELILPVAELNINSYLYPTSISVFRKQDDKFYYISDEIATNNWLGNKYDASIKAYRIDVTSYLQKYLKGKYKDCTLYLIPEGRFSSASRVILNGPSSTNPPKLNIIYSHPAEL